MSETKQRMTLRLDDESIAAIKHAKEKLKQDGIDISLSATVSHMLRHFSPNKHPTANLIN
ncbi:hypothetical protein [Vibrio harveyi]|uniref:hypothetical protein n=1 Tax=Vibrio harveyi TaxID=669 RepID=UPI00165E7F0E|nr:hypothetical protein [Vibrio harveyi]